MDTTWIDVFGYFPVDRGFTERAEQLQRRISDQPFASESRGPVWIYAVNADEMEGVTRQLGRRTPPLEESIIFPAWELGHYPEVWVEVVQKFKEVWCLSEFMSQSLRESGVERPVPVGLGVEIERPKAFISRRQLGIPDRSLVALTTVHGASYIARKNPIATVEAIVQANGMLGANQWHLVVKASGPTEGGTWTALRSLVAENQDQVTLIEEEYSRDQYLALLLNSDTYLSMHRAEGFGFGMAEAMSYGIPTMATGYSGNLDFMTSENSVLVPFETVAVGPDEYVYPEGQFWADPKVDSAAESLVGLSTTRSELGRLSIAGRRFASIQLNYARLGLRYREQLGGPD